MTLDSQEVKKVEDIIWQKTWEDDEEPNLCHGLSIEEIAEKAKITVEQAKEIVDILFNANHIGEAESGDGTYVSLDYWVLN